VAGSGLSQKGTVLTLRVKKSAVTALVDGKLNLDDFTKAVAVNTYAGNGYGLTSVNSWIISSGSGNASGGSFSTGSQRSVRP